MIALNETNEYAAEVAFNLPLSSDPTTGLTGHAFTLGEVQIKLPGLGWADATLAKIVEKGYGRYAVRLTPSQCTVAGDVAIIATVSTTQNYFGSDTIGVLGGDIPVGETGSIYFFLPDIDDPFGNPPLTGHTFATGEVRICLPNSTYADLDALQISEVGFGAYKATITTTQTALRGKAFIYANVTGYQPFEGYSTILGVGAAPSSITPPTPIPVPVTTSSPIAPTLDLITSAINRLCEYSKSGNFDAGVFIDNVGI